MATVPEIMADGNTIRFIGKIGSEYWFRTRIGDLLFPIPIKEFGNTPPPLMDEINLYRPFIRQYIDKRNQEIIERYAKLGDQIR